MLQSGDFEDVRLDEPFDLRERGAERFIAFQTDRTFKFRLNETRRAFSFVARVVSSLYVARLD